jgi:hypothetical protein
VDIRSLGFNQSCLLRRLFRFRPASINLEVEKLKDMEGVKYELGKQDHSTEVHDGGDLGKGLRKGYWG